MFLDKSCCMSNSFYNVGIQGFPHLPFSFSFFFTSIDSMWSFITNLCRQQQIFSVCQFIENLCYCLTERNLLNDQIKTKKIKPILILTPGPLCKRMSTVKKTLWANIQIPWRCFISLIQYRNAVISSVSFSWWKSTFKTWKLGLLRSYF